jgi:uncharacterized phage protein gp47/JayE
MDNRTFNEIRSDLVNVINRVRDPKTGYNFNVNVNDPSDLVAIIVNNIAQQISDKNELLLRIRNALNPYTATGRELRDVIEYRGLTAKRGSPTTATLSFTGTPPGILIPAGTRFTDEKETKFFLTRADVLTTATGISVDIFCDRDGPIPLTGNELTKISPAIPKLEITAPEATDISVGTAAETDRDIHLRLSQSTGSSGYGFLDVTDSALANLDGVKSAVTYLKSDAVVFDGDICSVVSGGDKDEIARTIFEKNMFLLKTAGNTTVTVKSAYLGREYTVKFERPTPVNQTLYVHVKAYGIFSDDIDSRILGDVSGFLGQYPPGATIYIADMTAFINANNGEYKMTRAAFDSDTGPDFKKPAWNKVASVTPESLHITKEDVVGI